MNTLASYLEQSGTPQERFAEAIGVKQATVSRLKNGSIRPSLKLAIVIDRATNGAVPVSCWDEEPSAARAS
jgi:DNA-binding XRE family transcriptional regulator